MSHVFISEFKEEVIDFVLHLSFLGTNMPWVYDFVSCSIGEVVGPDTSLIFFSFNEGYSKIFISCKGDIFVASLQFISNLPLLMSEVGSLRLLHAPLF